MGGTGSIQPVLNNNRKLLRKKSFFKKSTSEQKKDFFKNDTSKLQFKKVSKKELKSLKIKIKIRKEAKKRKLRNNIYLYIAFLITISILIVYTYKITKLEKELDLTAKIELFNKEQLINIQKYQTYMEDAEDQFNKEHWKNAIYFYKKALIIKPQDNLAKAKLKIAKNKFKALTTQ